MLKILNNEDLQNLDNLPPDFFKYLENSPNNFHLKELTRDQIVANEFWLKSINLNCWWDRNGKNDYQLVFSSGEVYFQKYYLPDALENQNKFIKSRLRSTFMSGDVIRFDAYVDSTSYESFKLKQLQDGIILNTTRRNISASIRVIDNNYHDWGDIPESLDDLYLFFVHKDSTLFYDAQLDSDRLLKLLGAPYLDYLPIIIKGEGMVETLQLELMSYYTDIHPCVIPLNYCNSKLESYISYHNELTNKLSNPSNKIEQSVMTKSMYNSLLVDLKHIMTPTEYSLYFSQLKSTEVSMLNMAFRSIALYNYGNDIHNSNSPVLFGNGLNVVVNKVMLLNLLVHNMIYKGVVIHPEKYQRKTVSSIKQQHWLSKHLTKFHHTQLSDLSMTSSGLSLLSFIKNFKEASPIAENAKVELLEVLTDFLIDQYFKPLYLTLISFIEEVNGKTVSAEVVKQWFKEILSIKDSILFTIDTTASDMIVSLTSTLKQHTILPLTTDNSEPNMSTGENINFGIFYENGILNNLKLTLNNLQNVYDKYMLDESSNVTTTKLNEQSVN